MTMINIDEDPVEEFTLGQIQWTYIEEKFIGFVKNVCNHNKYFKRHLDKLSKIPDY